MASRALRLAGLAIGLGLSAAAAVYQRDQAPMSASRPADGQQHLDATAGREVVFCHACSFEWYCDEQGLECPRCHSEITEVVCDNVQLLWVLRLPLLLLHYSVC